MSKFGYIKVATGTYNVAVGNVKKNTESMIQLMEQAQKEQVELLLFPELSLTGYTCQDLFLQRRLTDQAMQGLEKVCQNSIGKNMLIVVGVPLRVEGMLFNCAAFCYNGRVEAVVPKTYIPTYHEFYEKRWFSQASNCLVDQVELFGSQVPFGTNIIVETKSGMKVAAEICEDLWVNLPPSSVHTVYGANIIVNPSASNDLVSKKEYRRNLVSMQSARCLCAYVYASSGEGESTTDLIFSNHCMISENGRMNQESSSVGLMTALIDVEKLENDRIKMNSFAWNVPEVKQQYRRVQIDMDSSHEELPQEVNPYPFIPCDETEREERCKEILGMQARGLYERLKKIGVKKVVIGISGGLDSTLALLVTKRAFEMLQLPMENIICITMPGFGTSNHTKHNSLTLMELCNVTSRVIDIKAACNQHFKDIDHPTDQYDVTYENVQARERTQILMDVANKENAIVIGTGDLSELALGWCTYNGDHMSMYAVNVSIPKTLVRYLVMAYAHMEPELYEVLTSICDTEISPELLPLDANGKIQQKTEGTIGKYDLHDFFLYNFIRNGYSKEKIFALAKIAFPKVKETEIEVTLNRFFQRFFTQQFKRSCLPDGPKVGSVSLSPRGDWRMPSDADVTGWM